MPSFRPSEAGSSHLFRFTPELFPGDLRLFFGRRSLSRYGLGLGLKSAKLATVDAEAVGDSVVEIGRADLALGDGQRVTVKYVVQWKEEDGAWKWNVDIWNASE